MRRQNEAGNVVFYALMAISLLAMLIFAFARGGREDVNQQMILRITEELFVQANMIRSAIQQCALEFPAGGGDVAPVLAPDGVIDVQDNPYNPYPLNPSAPENANAPAGIAPAADDTVKNLTCVGAPADQAPMFTGVQNQGRFIPPPPTGFTEWTYSNSDGNGVSISITAPSTTVGKAVAAQLVNKYGGLPQAKLSASTIVTIWIVPTP